MCIIDCLSTIVFILPLYLDDTKVIILILWRRTFQLEYWRTFQLVSTPNAAFARFNSSDKDCLLGSYFPNFLYCSVSIETSFCVSRMMSFCLMISSDKELTAFSPSYIPFLNPVSSLLQL